MIRGILAAGVAACALMPCTASGATSEEVAAKFGAREFIRGISLSPEGKQVVIVTPKDGGEAAVVINLETAVSTSILVSDGRDQQISHCQFVLETRVVCTLLFSQGNTRNIDYATRMVSLSPDGKQMKELTGKSAKTYYRSNFGGGIVDYNVPGDSDSVLMERWFAPQAQTGSIGSRATEGLAVEKINITDLSRKTVETPKETAVGYITDGLGNVRIMENQQADARGEYARTQRDFSYRPAKGGPWKPLSSMSYDGSLWRGFQPVAVDAKENVAYGFDRKGYYKGLYKLALDGSGTRVDSPSALATACAFCATVRSGPGP